MAARSAVGALRKWSVLLYRKEAMMKWRHTFLPTCGSTSERWASVCWRPLMGLMHSPLRHASRGLGSASPTLLINAAVFVLRDRLAKSMVSTRKLHSSLKRSNWQFYSYVQIRYQSLPRFIGSLVRCQESRHWSTEIWTSSVFGIRLVPLTSKRTSFRRRVARFHGRCGSASPSSV